MNETKSNAKINKKLKSLLILELINISELKDYPDREGETIQKH